MVDARESYEQVPYLSNPLLPSHPAIIAAGVTLHGLEPPPVGRCRVLELGCGTGGNLIPMAIGLPESRFVGIDLSPGQIESGRAVVGALGLANVDLAARSILDVDERDGLFDYIVCHGVYSWVPGEVQEKILAVCARNLAPNGIGYVSYNTYPGWNMRGMVRGMMQFHARRFREPAERVQQARALLDFMAGAVPEGPYKTFLTEEAEMLREAPDFYLFHEHLEDVNKPLYFHEFVERLGPHGLQYVAEATPSALKPGEFAPEVQETLRDMAPDLVHYEQYLDFLRIRGFRRSLVCHRDLAVQRLPSWERVPALFAASHAWPERPPDLHATTSDRFRGSGNRTLTTSHPVLKAALVCLAERWPETPGFDELHAAVQGRLDGVATAGDPAVLAESLFECWVSGFVELYSHPLRVARHAGSRPLASPLARLQVPDTSRVANLNHRLTELNPLDRCVLYVLDGARDHVALVEDLRGRIASGELTLERDGKPLSGDACDTALLAEALTQSLDRLGRGALLLG